MNYVVAFLLVAVLLYLLIRSTHGALSLLGYRGWYSTEQIDPVCGLKVEANKGYGMCLKVDLSFLFKTLSGPVR